MVQKNNRLLFTLVACLAVSSCFKNKKSEKKIYKPVVVYKKINVNDSMSLFMFKMGGLNFSPENFISYEKDYCDVTLQSCIVYGMFRDFEVKGNDSLILIGTNMKLIENIKASRFKISTKGHNYGDPPTIDFFTTKKVDLSIFCKE